VTSTIDVPETGKLINWRNFAGRPLADIFNTLYSAEVQQQLRRYFGSLLASPPPEDLLRGIMPALAADPCWPGSAAEPENSRAFLEWSKALREAQGRPLVRASMRARLALGSGFWRTLDGATLRAETAEIDPLRHYKLRSAGWDPISRQLLAQAEAEFVECREIWLATAAMAVIRAIASDPQLDVEGMEAAQCGSLNRHPQRLARRLFEAQLRPWRLHRVGSVLEVLSQDGSPVQVFRDTKLLVADNLGYTSSLDDELAAKTAASIRHPIVYKDELPELVIKFCSDTGMDLAVSGSERVAKRMREAGDAPSGVSLERLEAAVTDARGGPLPAHRPPTSRRLAAEKSRK
jgi:hypothetical protein